MFDPERVLRALNEHGVAYVVIGGVAAAVLGSPSHTDDLDLCHDPSPDNVARLGLALGGLGAASAEWDVLGRASFSTQAGSVDCIERPAGTDGFAQLRRTAEPVVLAGVDVLVASLDDLILMKQAAGRPTDRVHLEILGALREELEGRQP